MVYDVDGPGNHLFIRDGKGGKDRYTILSTLVYHLLRAYWKRHCNSKWLFPAIGRGLAHSTAVAERMGKATQVMDTNSLRSHLRKAARKAGIGKKVTCHTPSAQFCNPFGCRGCAATSVAGLPGPCLHRNHSYIHI